MRTEYLWFLCFLVGALAKDCPNKNIHSKLICYYSKLTNVDPCLCTHLVVPANTDFKVVEDLKLKLRRTKILLTVNEFNQDLVKTLKRKSVDGLEINLKKIDSKDDIPEFINTVRSRLGNELYLVVSLPAKAELLAKYYNLKVLSKVADLFILQTAFLGSTKNVTFHPSPLSGLWDMQNTDSVVDLVTGLGAPLAKVAITLPVQGFSFKLQDESLTTPGSPALELRSLTRAELCNKINSGNNWTLERDQDQAGPYIFRGTEWISFEDRTSVDIKAKYARVRGLSGLALKDLAQDEDSEKCGGSLLSAAYAGLSKQTRAPRGAVLRSLEREILETPARFLDTVRVSPYRISRVIDVEGNVHNIRKDTRTEFQCSRQGYFVHPKSCARFYRCVKFDQHSEEFSVFEFDCPAGLAFDERVEVCVWPGSLPDGAPCSGSSEIAPVPRNRFVCPTHPGYYADPENCRWFFACLDHGQSGLTAYEFRCPFGLVFDEKRLLCEWPWLVSTCNVGDIYGLGLVSVSVFGGGAGSSVGKGSGTYVLQNYDGLGELGTVALGGYGGDLSALKSSQLVQPVVQQSYLQESGGASLAQPGLSYSAGVTQAQPGVTLTGSGLGHQVLLQQNANLHASGHSGALEAGGAGATHTQFSNIEHGGAGYIQGAGFDDSGNAKLQQELEQLRVDLDKYISDSNLQTARPYHDRGSIKYESTVQLNAGALGAGGREDGYLKELGQTAAGDVAVVTANLPQTTLIQGDKLDQVSHGGQVVLLDAKLNLNNADYGKQVSGGATSYVKINHGYNQGQTGADNVQLSHPAGFTVDYRTRYGTVQNPKAVYETNDQIDVINGKLNLPTLQPNVNAYSTQGYTLANAAIKTDLGSVQYSDNSNQYISNPELIPSSGQVLSPATSTLNGHAHAQYANEAKFVQPITSQTFAAHGQFVGDSGSYNGGTVDVDTPKFKYNIQTPSTFISGKYLAHDDTATDARGESAVHLSGQPTPGSYATAHIPATPETGVLHVAIHNSAPVAGQNQFAYTTQQLQASAGLPAEPAKSHAQFYSVSHGAPSPYNQTLVPQYQTISVTPNTDQLLTIKHQPQFIQTVSATPISNTQFYNQYSQKTTQNVPVETVSVTPKSKQIFTVESVTIAPTYESQTFDKQYQQISSLEQQPQLVTIQQQPQYVQTVNSAPTIYGKQVQQTTTVEHQPFVPKSEQIVTIHQQPGFVKTVTGVPQSYESKVHKVTTIEHQPILTVQRQPGFVQTVTEAPQYDTQFYGKEVQQSTTIEQQPGFIQTVKEVPQYDTQSYGKKVQQITTIEHQPIQTVPIAPKAKEILTVEHQPAFIQTVTTAPQYSTQFYGKQTTIEHQPVPTYSVTPKSQQVFTVHQQPSFIQNAKEVSQYDVPVYGQKVEKITTIEHQPIQTISVSPKSKEILTVEQQPGFIQTVTEVPQYDTQFYGKQVQQTAIEHQPIQTYSVTPKSEQIFTVHQQPGYIQTVKEVPQYSSPVYGKKIEQITTVEHQPVQTISVTPKTKEILTVHEQPGYIQTVTEAPQYDTQFYGKQVQHTSTIEHQPLQPVQTVSFVPKSEQILTVEHQPGYIKTVTEAPKYDTQFYEKKVQQTTFEHQPINTVPVTSKSKEIVTIEHHPGFIETVTLAPKYDTQLHGKTVEYTKIEHQPIAVSITPKSKEISTVEHQPGFIQTVTEVPQYDTQFYGKQVSITPKSEQVVTIQHQPQVIKTVSEGPLYETQFYSNQGDQNLQIQTGINRPKDLKLTTVYKHGYVAPTLETVSTGQNYQQEFYGKDIKEVAQPIAYGAKQPVVQKITESVSTGYPTITQTFGSAVEHDDTLQATYAGQAKIDTNFYDAKNTGNPTVVESYSFEPPQQAKVQIKYKGNEYLPPKTTLNYINQKAPEVFLSTTPKYSVFQDFIQPKQTFEIKKKVQPTVISEYKYENPAFINYKTNLNFDGANEYYQLDKTLKDLPLATKINYGTNLNFQSMQDLLGPAGLFADIPKIQANLAHYSTEKPLQVPTFISTPRTRTKVTTFAPTTSYSSTIKPTYTGFEGPRSGGFYYYDSRYNTSYRRMGETPTTAQYLTETADFQPDTVSTARPLFVSTVTPAAEPKRIVSTTVPVDYSPDYVVTTYKPKLATTYQPQYNTIVTTTALPIEEVSSTIKPSTFRGRVRQKVVTTTVAPEETYASDNFDSDYIVTTAKPIVTTTYKSLINKKKKIVTTTAIPKETFDNYEYDEYLVSSEKPVEIVKVITPKPKGKTVVRVNDFHPFLTTKLGAQCTCVSNGLKVRRPKIKAQEADEFDYSLPVTKITSSGPAAYDDYQEPGVYVVGNTDSYDYEYEPQKISSITDAPGISIKSTTNAVQPAPAPVFSSRVTSVSPIEISSVTSTPELAFSSTLKSVPRKKSKEEKIAEAVNEGLSLVKSAIKGYVDEAIEARNYDRYGPGGWRTRDETLQGTVDCQRAGLFRHPTQCNKFYACHWDCTKQRYTLHVFNCPVHLTFDTRMGACNWPSKGPACADNTLLPNV